MNSADVLAQLDQMRRNLSPTKQLIFTITSTGVVTIHKTYGWGTAFAPTDIVLAAGVVTITSRGSEFSTDGLFVTINTNPSYNWVSTSILKINAVFGISNKMSVQIRGEL